MDLKSVASLDAPEILDCSFGPSNIPASSSPPLQVVAKLPFSCVKLVVVDALGQYVNVYRGPIGKETYVGRIGGGGRYFVDVDLRKGDRVSLRSTDNTVVNTGTLTVDFLAYTSSV